MIDPKAARGWLAPALLLAASAALADPGFIVHETELKAAPDLGSATVTKLTADTPVEVGERKGGWMRVSRDGASGWVKLMNLRFGAAPRRQGDSGVGALLNTVTTGRSGTAVATGVRGLGQEDQELSAAKPNPEALKALDALQVSKDEATHFSEGANLSPQTIDYAERQDSGASQPENPNDLKI